MPNDLDAIIVFSAYFIWVFMPQDNIFSQCTKAECFHISTKSMLFLVYYFSFDPMFLHGFLGTKG